MFRNIRHFLSIKNSSENFLFSKRTENLHIAQKIIFFYYFCPIIFMVWQYKVWIRMIHHSTILPLWPITWINFVDAQIGIIIILLISIIGFCIAAFFSQHSWARIIACIAAFQLAALINSYGKVSHYWHGWVLTSFLLIFLPNDWKESSQTMQREKREKIYLIFSACQIILLLGYSMAGVWKFIGAIYQISMGEVNLFSPEAFATHIADRLLQTNVKSIAGDFMIEHHFIGSVFLISGVYIQAFSLCAAFRPALQKIWGLLLISFHIGTALTLTIGFWEQCALLILFFLFTPFDYKNISIKERILQFPLLYGFQQRLKKKISSI